ncbi:hypothetical protein Syun_028080 [Stephania yunnanensis]|uniref:Uncharacterized protein n=1 Tax=Stephania yunnanensis TaxID=152371 RepID=A0AAP0EH34_9MAGN
MASTGGGGGGGGAAIAAAAAEELRAMANGGHHKTVLITGVGRGLGRALAIEMARRGHTVFGFSRDFYDLESLGLILFYDPDHCHVLFHLAVHDDETVSLFAHNAIDLMTGWPIQLYMAMGRFNRPSIIVYAVTIKHTPRVNGSIPDVTDVTLDHERLLATYDLAELQIEGDGNCQVGLGLILLDGLMRKGHLNNESFEVLFVTNAAQNTTS